MGLRDIGARRSMKIEQTGVDRVTITLETDLERDTLGHADKLEVRLKYQENVGFVAGDSERNVTLERQPSGA
jgi:hypothetical protein